MRYFGIIMKIILRADYVNALRMCGERGNGGGNVVRSKSKNPQVFC